MKGNQLEFDRTWTVGKQIGAGGFGKVFVVTSEGDEAVAKFVPKAPGADRELLFIDLSDVVNVVPIIDSGETEDSWVLVMPRAERSLREHLEAEGNHLDLAEAVAALIDICDALVSLDGRVVHRDLKPENVLLLDGRWCLADFGISRYAEATTAPDTHKFAMSPPYAAPERWRSERATAASDVYAVGVIGFEMLSGERPFNATSMEDLRDQHLHSEPPHLSEVPAPLGALIDECLYKAPEARPTPANLRARLERTTQPPASGGLSVLEEANRAEVLRRQEAARSESEARTESERRAELAAAAQRSYDRISSALRTAIESAAPSAVVTSNPRGGWNIRLGDAQISMAQTGSHRRGEWGGWQAPAFDVVLLGAVSVRIPADRNEYEGRSHSLWYCDAQEKDRFSWYETSFMVSPLIPKRGRQDPFALDPGEDAAKAVWSGMAEFQLAWPFTELVVGDLDEFVDRWAGWFAEAAQGRLAHPSSMPERPPQDSWRRS